LGPTSKGRGGEERGGEAEGRATRGEEGSVPIVPVL